MGLLEIRTDAVRGAAGRIGAVPGMVTTAASEVGCAQGAADDTDAAGAYDALASRLGVVAGQYAATVDELATAMDLAAQCYEAADRLPTPGE